MRTTLVGLALVAALGACEAPVRRPPEGRFPGADETRSVEPRADQAPIVLDTPQEGEELTSPAVLSGTADVFEATVSYRIVTGDGDVVARGFTTASCGSGCRGSYSVTVPFEVEEETEATIEVFEESAETGRPTHKVEIGITLLP